MVNILFDIGGSRMRFAKVNDENGNSISDPVIVKTPDNYIDSISLFNKTVTEISGGEEINYLIGGIAGVFNTEGARLLLSPNLKEWERKPLKEDLSRMTGAQRVIIKNDTDMTGLGEAVFGAGRDHDIVAYLTFSTGIGGSLIVNKDIAPYNLGFEPGFQIINEDSMKTLHDISGTALKEKYDGKFFRDITDEKTRKEIMRSAIVGIHNTIVFWSPEVIVLGGGMTETFDIDYIYKELEKINLRFPDLPEIVFAQIEDVNGIYGALAYFKMQS